MKLLKLEACHWASDGGNVKIMTVMGDASMEGLSDRGSIPLRSTYRRCVEPVGFDFSELISLKNLSLC